MTENEISKIIINSAYKVYFGIGPGLLESIYEKLLSYELQKAGLKVERQVEIPIIYDGKQFGSELRADLVVEGKVIIELKSVEELTPVFYKQLQTYLRLKNLHLGLLINFNTSVLKDNIHRVVNHLAENRVNELHGKVN